MENYLSGGTLASLRQKRNEKEINETNVDAILERPAKNINDVINSYVYI